MGSFARPAYRALFCAWGHGGVIAQTQAGSRDQDPMTINVLSPERLCLFHEFIWRAMGNLHDSAWRDMLDPTTPLGAMVRADYAALAGGRHWDP